MDMWQILGSSKVSFHHADKPVRVHSENGDLISLLEICKSSTPPCRLAPWLFNGHLQTLWTAINNQDPPMFYKRKVFEAEDRAFSGSFAVDFVVPQYNGTDDNLPRRTAYFSDQEFELMGGNDKKPMLVVLHGLSGGSYEAYVRHTLLPLVQHREWEACVINSRGCAKSEISSNILYNARATWDMRQTVKWLKGKFPNRPLFGIGFSLGACILVNVRSLDSFQMQSAVFDDLTVQYVVSR
ncbi:MAG: hypothetical protein Q9167_004977 [Letrouitia subvulpina]